MVLSFIEIVNILIMTGAVGFITMGMFKPPVQNDPLKQFEQDIDWKKQFLYACAVVAPAIILHEFGHKFTALAFGLDATFKTAYVWLLVGIVLKLMKFPFLFFVPAYVLTYGANAMQLTLIAFMGPAVNGLIWLISLMILKSKTLTNQQRQFWFHTKLINGFLALFNLIPIPGFDGSQVFRGLQIILFG